MVPPTNTLWCKLALRVIGNNYRECAASFEAQVIAKIRGYSHRELSHQEFEWYVLYGKHKIR